MKYIIQVIKIIDKISEITGKIASSFIIIMVILHFQEVILRYIFQRPTTWSWEIATYLYGANFILAGAWALKQGRHVRTDFVFGRLSPKWQAIVDLSTFCTIFLLFIGLIGFFAIRSAINSTVILETSYTMSPIPIWPLKIVIAYGFTILFLQGLAKITRDIIFLVKGENI